MVDLMGMPDGDGRELGFVAFCGRDRSDHWTP
jgi:hypothetical protein